MSQGRGSLYILTGLLVGFLLGLVYSWWIQPSSATYIRPNTLTQEDKDRYRTLIAMAFTSNGDLVRARARLELLGEPDFYQSVFAQLQRTIAAGRPLEEIRALRLLAGALQSATSPIPSVSPGTPQAP